MLTNVHNWILREILRKTQKNFPLDIFLYNIAPDALSMHKDVSAELTHKVNLTEKLLKKYPKLIYVKAHIIVDNIGHYGEIYSTPVKKGYSYLKGENIRERVKEFCNELKFKQDEEFISYLTHTVVEIALDFKISEDDPTISELFLKIQREIPPDKYEEYVEAISSLYKIDREIVKEARKEPFKFYGGEISSFEDFFLNRRVRLILRKTEKEFTEENISSARELVRYSLNFLDDYNSFLDDAVEKLEIWFKSFYKFSNFLYKIGTF